MLPTKTLLSLLAASASLVNAAAVPAAAASPDDNVLVLEGPFPINATTLETRSSSILSKRADCYTGSGINTPDLTELARQLQNDNPDQLTYLPALSWTAWTYGSARTCVYNNYVYDNTHVKRWEAGWGSVSVKNQCCYTPYCGGGKQQGHGDSGLAVDIVVKPVGQGC
ncbi:MAG: hypothetical protein LQ346_004684 [Caloplaca aetnensis]|nr:MAG: hypothetical protein LQ346_004684 [Caloplaca aetnensis]